MVTTGASVARVVVACGPAVLPSPNRWRADNPGPYVRGRASSIAGRARVVRNERMAACVLIMDRADN